MLKTTLAKNSCGYLSGSLKAGGSYMFGLAIMAMIVGCVNADGSVGVVVGVRGLSCEVACIGVLGEADDGSSGVVGEMSSQLAIGGSVGDSEVAPPMLRGGGVKTINERSDLMYSFLKCCWEFCGLWEYFAEYSVVLARLSFDRCFS